MKKKTTPIIDELFGFSLSSRTAMVVACEILFGLFMIVFSSYFFAHITKETLFENEVTQFDTQLSQNVYSLRNTDLTRYMIIISLLGADFILMISTIIVIVLAWKKHRKESLLFLIMLFFGGVLNLWLKEVFQRPRPSFDPVFTLSSYSYPSGHAMNSFVFYATLAYFTFHFSRSKKLTCFITVLSIFLILLIGFSRVYLGVHYPSDVLAGFTAGLLWFSLVLVIRRTITFFELFREYRK